MILRYPQGLTDALRNGRLEILANGPPKANNAPENKSKVVSEKVRKINYRARVVSGLSKILDSLRRCPMRTVAATFTVW